MAQLLITGGAGFIGSHTCLVLLEAGHSLVVIDSYVNSSPESLRRVGELSEVEIGTRLRVFKGDIRNAEHLDIAFELGEEPVDAVIHFAGLKAVRESLKRPLSYWDVNLGGSRCLLEAMKRHGCFTIVFSSSATLYGYTTQIPTPENALVKPINPYGNTKSAVEQLLADLSESEPNWRIACLRYFNPVGAHPSGLIGEDPYGIPDNLFPFVSQVAIGRRDELQIYGMDWPTSDGSAVRDYIHVMDLAEGHCAALDFLQNGPEQLITLNLGSGQGHSVMQVVLAFEKISGKKVPYRISGRRPGDVACSIADSSLAAEYLNWETKRNLSDMCRDAWTWQKGNPFGYGDKG